VVAGLVTALFDFEVLPALVEVALPGLPDLELLPGLILVFIVVGLAGLTDLPVLERPGTPPVGRTIGRERLAPRERVGSMMVTPDP